MLEFFNIFKKEPVSDPFNENKELLSKLNIDYSQQDHAHYLEGIEMYKLEPLSLPQFVSIHLSDDYSDKDRFEKEMDLMNKGGLMTDYLTCLGDSVHNKLKLKEERRAETSSASGRAVEKSIWHLVAVDTHKSTQIF